MNSRDRVFATMKGEATDRRPFSGLLSLYGARLTASPLEKYYSSSEKYAAGQRAVRDAFQPDLLFSPFALPLWGAAFGGEIRFFDSHPPNLKKPVITSVDEISRLSVPDMDVNPHILFFRKAVQQMVEEHGNEVPIIGSMLSPVDLPIMIMGIEAWLKTVLFNADGVKRMLELTVPTFLAFTNALFEDGISAMALPTAFLTPAIATRKIVREIAYPVLWEVLPQVKGPLVIHHVGSPFLKFLDLFSDLPNTAGFAMDVTDDPGKSREIIGSDKTLLMGPDGASMNRKTAQQILEECMVILDDRVADPRFILSTCGPDIAYDTPKENILAMLRAVETFK
ncbi:uroporphyrinogen decarboxylase family protein [Candidatus Riflebacteria bacterium]